jgi:outer membrane protein assembly factor BamB
MAVRHVLKDAVPRFFEMPITDFPSGYKIGTEASREEEAARLADAVVTILQLNSSKPDPGKGIGVLRGETDAIWEGGDRYFERRRQEFAFGKLADWIIEIEEEYRQAHLPPVSESDSELVAFAARTDPVEPPGSEKSPPPEPADDEVADESEHDDPNERSAGLGDEHLVIVPPPIESGGRLRIGRLAGGAFAVALVVGILVAASLLSDSGGEGSGNPAGEIRRVLNVPAPEDLAVAGGFVWLVDANDETVIRVSEANGKRDTIFVDQPPLVSGPLPGSDTHTGARIGGYRVAAGPNGIWIVTNGGAVLTVGTIGRQARILNPHIRIIAGEPVLYHGSLWVAGFGQYLYRLRALDGVIQREYELSTNPFHIDNVAAGVGSIWAYNESGGDPKINILTPVPGRHGVRESILPLDHPAFDLAAGLGGVWTVNSDGTVTWHDPATGGSSRLIQVPGEAQEIALSRDAVWVTTGNNSVVRLDPTTLKIVGEPIKLPGSPLALAADENVWVATAKKLVEIDS